MTGSRNYPFVILFLTALLVRFAAAVYWEHYIIPNNSVTDNTAGEVKLCGGKFCAAKSCTAKFCAAKFYFGDSDTYWQLGKALAEGKPYLYGENYIHRMPGYPVLLSPLFLIYGKIYGSEPPVFAARTGNIIFGVLTVFAVVLLAQQLFHNRNISLLAGFFIALDPLQIVMSILVLSEAPFCFFMVMQFLFFAVAWEKNSNCLLPLRAAVFFIFSGLMYAAAVYCRPSWLYFVPFSMLAGAVICPRSFRRIVSSGIIIAAVLALCLLPWIYRNYQITGHFIAATLQAGPSLYDGLSPAATGKSEMSFVETFRDELLKEDSKQTAKLKDTPEYRLNRKLNQLAWDWAKKHPDKALELAKRKFFRLWNFFPNEESFSNTAVRIAVFCSFSPVFILGLCGVIASFRKGFAVQYLWLPALYITILHIIFVSSIRYRCPAMPGLAILAAWFAVIATENTVWKQAR